MKLVDKRWLNPCELKELLKISESTQAKLRMQKRIPYCKTGKFIHYDKFDIDKWLENNKVIGA